jgi:Domain of unknown function (DUF4388)
VTSGQKAGNGGRLSQDRAEILRLITQLTARGVARRERERPAGAMGEEARRRVERNRADAGVVPLLRSLEARLTRLEERISQRRSSRPSPPPNGAIAGAPEGATFSGVIQGQMLSDMLQLVSSNDLSGEFVVETGDQECHLYFELGRICHASAPGIEGEEAFFAAFGADSGKYWFSESADPPPKKTIDANTQFLILEALRRIDESRA